MELAGEAALLVLLGLQQDARAGPALEQLPPHLAQADLERGTLSVEAEQAEVLRRECRLPREELERRPVLGGERRVVERLDPAEIDAMRLHRRAGPESVPRLPARQRDAVDGHFGRVDSRHRERLGHHRLTEALGRVDGAETESRSEQAVLAQVRGAHPIAEVAGDGADGEKQ